MIFQGMLVASGLASATATTAICARASKIGRALHLTSRPDGIRRLHEGETPLIGGVAVLVPVLAVSLYSVFGYSQERWMVVAILITATMTLLGLLDDVLDLSSGWRFAAITFIVFCAFSLEPSFVLHTLRFQYWRVDVNVPLDPLAAPVTALIILGFMNAVNMADGMNGQLLGSAILWSLFIGLRMSAWEGLPFMLVICSAAPALIFNLRNKLFSGSAGAYGLAAFIAFGAIAAYRNTHSDMHALTPVCWFWLPVADCLRLLVERAFAGRSPDTADRRHFHHKLLGMMRPRNALVVYLLFVGVPGALTVISEMWGKVGLLVCVLLYAAVVVRAAPSPRRAANANAAMGATSPVLAKASLGG